jgi:hypothetical protein
MKTPGGWIDPGRRALEIPVWCRALEHPQHDGADEGDYEICGHNAHSVDQRHEKSPCFTSLPALTLKASKPFRTEKVSFAVTRVIRSDAAPPSTWLKTRKINALKSP